MNDTSIIVLAVAAAVLVYILTTPKAVGPQPGWGDFLVGLGKTATKYL